ncbi:hypothetical protein ASE36_20800 [Rhizobium sp. Root274]|nr:hypothetical protein ASE36_20800 [Rhizobium sp. Root274]
MAPAGLGGLALVVQLSNLPSMPAGDAAKLSTIIGVLMLRKMALGMLTFMTVFAGHFGFFTYLRPFLEIVTQAGPQMVTWALLIFGLGTFVGSSISGYLISRSLSAVMAMMPLLLAVIAVMLAQLGGTLLLDVTLVGLWGVAFGIIPVSWSTLVTTTVPDEPETGGAYLSRQPTWQSQWGAGLAGSFSVSLASRLNTWRVPPCC